MKKKYYLGYYILCFPLLIGLYLLAGVCKVVKYFYILFMMNNRVKEL